MNYKFYHDVSVNKKIEGGGGGHGLAGESRLRARILLSGANS